MSFVCRLGFQFEFIAVELGQKLYKKEEAAKYRANGVSGILCGKTLFFPRFFQKSVRGVGQSPI